MKADYPSGFVNRVVNKIRKGETSGDETAKPFISGEIPNCELNKIKS